MCWFIRCSKIKKNERRWKPLNFESYLLSESVSRGNSICVMCPIFISFEKFIRFPFRYQSFERFSTCNLLALWTLNTEHSQQSNATYKLLFVCALNIQLLHIVCALIWIYEFHVLKSVHRHNKSPRKTESKTILHFTQKMVSQIKDDERWALKQPLNIIQRFSNIITNELFSRPEKYTETNQIESFNSLDFSCFSAFCLFYELQCFNGNEIGFQVVLGIRSLSSHYLMPLLSCFSAWVKFRIWFFFFLFFCHYWQRNHNDVTTSEWNGWRNW